MANSAMIVLPAPVGAATRTLFPRSIDVQAASWKSSRSKRWWARKASSMGSSLREREAANRSAGERSVIERSLVSCGPGGRPLANGGAGVRWTDHNGDAGHARDQAFEPVIMRHANGCPQPSVLLNRDCAIRNVVGEERRRARRDVDGDDQVVRRALEQGVGKLDV